MRDESETAAETSSPQRSRTRREAGRAPTASFADRFLTAWKTVERCLVQHWCDENGRPGREAPDAESLLRWGKKHRLFPPDVEDYLHSCRLARNAYAHVAFDAYAGPITLPPRPVVIRLERIAASLAHPAKVDCLAPRAELATSSTRLCDALRVMRQSDYSQLPYRHDSFGWVLVTRDQVARWVEVEAEEDGAAIVDLTVPVSALAEDARVGPVVPRTIKPSSLLSHAVRELEEALRVPDPDVGGYPLVLVTGDDAAVPRVFAADDLPKAYAILGR